MFHQGDAITIMKTMDDHTVDLIYSNPPFNGATKNKWDTVIDWPVFFSEAFRLLKPNGNLILHCAVPFNYTLIRSAPQPPSYSWYWKKERVTLPFIAKYQPLRCVEEILVWKAPKGNYYPQRVGNQERTFTSKGNSTYYGNTVELRPQTVKGTYQTHFLDMKREIDGFSTRPKAMIRMLYDSYSKVGDTVLDPFCNDGLSSTCCHGRNWIGIDLFHKPKHFKLVDGGNPIQ
jgi:site-specific DNA-methyltransferase (adenine-specific)